MSTFKSFSGTVVAETDSALCGDYFECGLAALQAHNLEEAYLCFTKLPDSPTAQFNLALCYCEAGLPERALAALATAENLLTGQTAPLPQCPAVPPELVKHDGKADGYRRPMSKQTATLLPRQARLRMLRLKADLCAALEDGEELRRLLLILHGKGYGNIELLERQL